jgi:MFS family permease
MALGPVVGGLLVGSVGWQAIFWVNIPVGLAALVLAGLYIPESRAPRPRRVDPVGQLAVIVLLGSLTFGIIEAPTAGWGSTQSLLCFGLAASALVVLLIVESRRFEPLIELRFFRSVPFAGATVIAVSGFAGLGGFLFLNTLFLQEVRDFSALRAGLCTLPMALATLVFSPLSGRLVGARGPRLPLVAAGLAMGASALLLVGLSAQTPLWVLLLSYALFGIGFGMLNAPVTNTAVSGMPRAQAGVAAAVTSTSRQIGQTLGVAVIGSVVTSAVVGTFRTGFAQASHIGWWIVVGCATSVLVLGLATTSERARGTAQRVFDRIEDKERTAVNAS